MPSSAAPPPAPPGTALDRAADLALRGLVAAGRALPWERRVPLGGAVLRRAAAPVAGWRRRALANLALVRPDWSEARRRAVAEAALDNLGRALMENYAPAGFARRLAATPLSGEGVAAFAAARAEGRPVVLLSGHFGNYEAWRHVLHREGHLVAALYREMANPYVNAHYARTLEAVSGPAFPQGRGTLGFVRHLARGGIAGMLFDVHVAEGVPIPFLGRPAMTATTPADLALRTGALLVPCFGIRRPDGLSFDVALEAAIPQGDPVAMMAEATRRLEARIEADPGQWFWIHRRWKAIPARFGPVTPPSPPP